eukprot:COSAG06_NODE_433_length_15843_cov_10.266768_19_plen_264_part_00
MGVAQKFPDKFIMAVTADIYATHFWVKQGFATGATVGYKTNMSIRNGMVALGYEEDCLPEKGIPTDWGWSKGFTLSYLVPRTQALRVRFPLGSPLAPIPNGPPHPQRAQRDKRREHGNGYGRPMKQENLTTVLTAADVARLWGPVAAESEPNDITTESTDSDGDEQNADESKVGKVKDDFDVATTLEFASSFARASPSQPCQAAGAHPAGHGASRMRSRARAARRGAARPPDATKMGKPSSSSLAFFSKLSQCPDRIFVPRRT